MTDAFSVRRCHQSKNNVVFDVLPCKKPNTSSKKKRTYCGLPSFNFKALTISIQLSNKLEAVYFNMSILNPQAFIISNSVLVLEVLSSLKKVMYCVSLQNCCL